MNTKVINMAVNHEASTREKDINNRVNIARLKCRETTGVMCDKNIQTQLKDKVYKTALKPAIVYGAECWAVRKKEGTRLHTTEMRMSKLDHVRNVDIWKQACRIHVPDGRIPQREEMIWFGHVQRRDKDEATRKILQMTVDGKRNRGRPDDD